MNSVKQHKFSLPVPPFGALVVVSIILLTLAYAAYILKYLDDVEKKIA